MVDSSPPCARHCVHNVTKKIRYPRLLLRLSCCLTPRHHLPTLISRFLSITTTQQQRGTKKPVSTNHLVISPEYRRILGASPIFSRIPPPPVKGLVWAAAEDTVDMSDSVFRSLLPFWWLFCRWFCFVLVSSALFIMEVMQSFFVVHLLFLLNFSKSLATNYEFIGRHPKFLPRCCFDWQFLSEFCFTCERTHERYPQLVLYDI